MSEVGAEYSQVLYTIQAINVAMAFITLITLFAIFPACLLDFLFASPLNSASICKLGV